MSYFQMMDFVTIQFEITFMACLFTFEYGVFTETPFIYKKYLFIFLFIYLFINFRALMSLILRPTLKETLTTHLQHIGSNFESQITTCIYKLYTFDKIPKRTKEKLEIIISWL